MTEAPTTEVVPGGSYVRPEETPHLLGLSLGQAKWIGLVFSESGFFKDARQEAQAITKIIAGQELGLKPMEAMTNLHVYDGKVSLGATLMARMIKQHPNYRYKLLRSDAEACVVQISELVDGEWQVLTPDLGFTIQEAPASLLSKPNWANYPSDMLFARAISRAARRHCSDVFGGTVYTIDEMEDEGHTTSSPQERRAEILDSQAADLAAIEKHGAEAAGDSDAAGKGKQEESARATLPVPETGSSPDRPTEPSAANPSPKAVDEASDGSPSLFESPPAVEPAAAGVLTSDTPASEPSDAVTSEDEAAVKAKILELAAVIGAERTQKGYDKLRKSIGMIEGETYSTHSQVEQILSGLEEALVAYSPKQEIPS